MTWRQKYAQLFADGMRIMAANLCTGDRITIEDHKGRQVVTVVGFQVGTGDMVVDDGTGDNDAVRFCGSEDIIAVHGQT